MAAPRPGSAVAFFPVTLERAWRALPAAYRSVDLRINAIDSAAFAVGDSFTVHGKLDAYPLSDLIDCGTTTTGRGADSVDVTMFVTSRLQAVQRPIIAVTNMLQAIEYPPGGAPIVCRSLGVIEQTLIAVLRRQLGP